MYEALGISKQAVYKIVHREYRQKEEWLQLANIVREVRRDHPTMGVRDIYYMARPESIGRDRFENFCRMNGLMSVRKVRRCHTTDSSGVVRFPDLSASRPITNINQLWQSDITYFEVGGQFAYITFITDRFSSRIVGYSTSERLFTEDTVRPALRKAVQTREVCDLSGLVFHSDGGGQYYSKDFLRDTEKLEFRNSMCTYPWENGLAERINGIIKNNYLVHWNIKSFKQLTKAVDRAVSLYNNKKPHVRLKRMTPVEYEKKLSLQMSTAVPHEGTAVDICKG